MPGLLMPGLERIMLFESSAPPPGVCDYRSLVEAISQGNRDALTRLIDLSADAVRAELTARLPDADQISAVFAAIYVEVWWLAGCHSEAGIDVLEWIRNILHRRIADTRPGPTGLDPAVDRWPSHAEIELATLLRQRPPKPSDRPVR